MSLPGVPSGKALELKGVWNPSAPQSSLSHLLSHLQSVYLDFTSFQRGTGNVIDRSSEMPGTALRGELPRWRLQLGHGFQGHGTPWGRCSAQACMPTGREGPVSGLEPHRAGC